MAETEPKEDHVLESVVELGVEATSMSETFKKAILPDGTVDLVTLTRALSDALGIIADLAAATGQAHREHFAWGNEVDEELDQIRAQLGEVSVLIAEDAERLKVTIELLVAALPASADPGLKAQADEALAFIESITEEDDEDEETES